MGRVSGPVKVGSWIKVYWDGDDTWYNAEVTELDPLTEWCKVLYDDGEREEFRLSEVEYKHISADKMREKQLEQEDAGAYSKKRLRYIHHTLIDMADRLPELAVRKDCRQWWETWQDSVTKAAHVHNFPGLVQLTGLLGEQINVVGIDGKVDVTTDWWKTERKDWQAQLKKSASYGDVASRVQDLLLRAVDWTAARNLFTSADDTDVSSGDTPVTTTGEKDTVPNELKRKELVGETITAEFADARVLSVEADLVGDAPSRDKRRRLIKKTVGEVTQVTDREEEENCDSPSWVGFEVPCFSRTTKKRRVGDTAEFKSTQVRVGGDFGMLGSKNRSYPIRVATARQSQDIFRFSSLEEQQKVQGKETCSDGTVVGRKKLRWKKKKKKKKKLQDRGNLGKTLVLAESHVIEKKKRGREKEIQLVESVADALPSFDKGSVCLGDASPVLNELPVIGAPRNYGNGNQFLPNGSASVKGLAKAKEHLDVTTSGVRKSDEDVSQGEASGTKPEVKRKRGRPRKVVLLHGELGLSSQVTSQADWERRPTEIFITGPEAQVMQQKGRVNQDVDTVVGSTVRGDPQLTLEKVAAGLCKEMPRRKPGRPRKVQPLVMGFHSNGTIDNQRVGGSAQGKDSLKPKKKRGRPRKSAMKETWRVPAWTSSRTQHIDTEDEENGFLSEAAPQKFATFRKPGDSSVNYIVQEGRAPKKEGDRMEEELPYAARTEMDIGLDGPTADQSTPIRRKPGRPRKTPAQVKVISRREVTSPTSSHQLSCHSREDHDMREASCNYKRRVSLCQDMAESFRILQEKTADGEENRQNRVAVRASSPSSDDLEQKRSTRVQFSLSEENRRESVVGNYSLPAVSDDALIKSSNPVLADDIERKYYRRNFRKSPGRPPRKVVQEGRQKGPTSADLSQCAAQSQPQWKEVQLKSGEEMGAGLSPSGIQQYNGGTVAVLVAEQGNQTLNHNHVPQTEKATTDLPLNDCESSATDESPGRSKQSLLISLSLEPQTLHIPEQDMICDVVLSSAGDNVQHDGHLLVSEGMEIPGTNKKRWNAETEKSLDDDAGGSQRERVGNKLVGDSLLDEDAQFRHQTHRILSRKSASMDETEEKLGSFEVQHEGLPQVAVDTLQTSEPAAPRIFLHSRACQTEAELSLAPFDGSGKQQELAPLREETSVTVEEVQKCDSRQTEEMPAVCEESVKNQKPTGDIHVERENPQTEEMQVECKEPVKNEQPTVDVQVECDNPEIQEMQVECVEIVTNQRLCVDVQVERDSLQVKEMQVECVEPVKNQHPTGRSTDVACSETEYPSWGEKLCSDSDEETESLPVCGDRTILDDGKVKNLEQELLEREAFSRSLKPTKPFTTVLEDTSEGSSIRRVSVPADLSTGADDTRILVEEPDVISDIVHHIGEVNVGQAVDLNPTPIQVQNGVPSELMCNICNVKDAEDQMLLCKERGCTCAIHTFCLNPPLQVVPTDVWTCLHCACMGAPDMNEKKCSPKRFPPKTIQAVIGRRSNLVKDELKRSGHMRVEYLVKWDTLSHWHDSWVHAAWFVGERKRHITIFESRHPDLRKIDVSNEVDDSTIDERKPEWLLIDRVIKCSERGVGELDPSELARIGYKRQGVQFLVKWQGLDYRNATWEEMKLSKDMREAVSGFILRHKAAELDDVHPCPKESVAASISRQPDYIQGGSMYDYQVQGLRWLLSNFEAKRSVILADEMGLGKTVQAVAFIACLRNEKLSKKPVLVVAPKNTLSGWEQELNLWAPGLNTVVYQGENDNRDVIRRCEFYTEKGNPLFEVLLTSYELAIDDSRALCKFYWAAIIVDEGHRVRNMRAKLGGVLKEHQAEFRLLLTGTPVQNTVSELVSLFHFLDPVEFPNENYAGVEFTGAVNDIDAHSDGSEVRSKQLAKFHQLLKPRMLRRVKTDVHAVRIPGKKIVDVSCSLTPFQRRLYTGVLKRNHRLLNLGVQSGSGLKRSLNNILMDLKMVCNHPYLFPDEEPQGLKPEEASRMMVDVSGKLLFLEKLLPMLKEGGHRVLLFSQMTRMLDIIEDFLEIMGLSFVRIDGSTSAAERHRAIADFNHPECTDFIFLSSTGAGGLGINLRSADTVIIYDPDFNPFVDLQAQARAQRIGQEKIVLVYQLITEGSVEEKIVDRFKKKLALENMVMTSGLKDRNQTKETTSDISEVLLHGLDRILDEHHDKPLCTEHTVESVQKLLDRTISESSPVINDDYGYLGAVQGYKYILQGAVKQVDNPEEGGYGEKWRELLSRLVQEDEKEEPDKGHRRSQVKYSMVQNVAGQENVVGREEGQEDDEGNRTSSGDNSSYVNLEAEGRLPSPRSTNMADFRLEIGQEVQASKLQRLPCSSVSVGEGFGKKLSLSSPAVVPCTSEPAMTAPQLHQVVTPGNLGTFSSTSFTLTGIGGLPGLPEVAPRPVVNGSTVTNAGLVYERVVSSHGIGIHLNRLLPATRNSTSVRTPLPPTTPGFGNAVLAYTEPTLASKPVHFRGPVDTTPASNGAASALPAAGSCSGGNTSQFASPHSTSVMSSTVRGYTGLPGGDKYIHGGNSASNGTTTSGGTPGRCTSLQAAGLVSSEPEHLGLLLRSCRMPAEDKSLQAVGSVSSAAGHPTMSLAYSASSGGISVQNALPPAAYVPPVRSVNSAVHGSCVSRSGGQSGEVCRRPQPTGMSVPASASCVISGHPSVSINSIQGSLPGVQNYSNVKSAATSSTEISVPLEPISDKVSSSPEHPAVSQLPFLGQIGTCSGSDNRVLSCIRLKRSARDRHKLAIVPSRTQAVTVMNNTNLTSATAAPALSAAAVVSPSGSRASQPGGSASVANESVMHLNASITLISVPASDAPVSSPTEAVVSPLHTTAGSVSCGTCQPVGITDSEGPIPVEWVYCDVTQRSTNSTYQSGVVFQPIARAQVQRKPLWVPKGDAGLLMGPVQNM